VSHEDRRAQLIRDLQLVLERIAVLSENLSGQLAEGKADNALLQTARSAYDAAKHEAAQLRKQLDGLED